MAFKEKRIAVIGGGLGGLSFMNSALYAGLTNIHLYEAAAEFTEVVSAFSSCSAKSSQPPILLP
jgi:2-polyprenyl-6-methoxyphenol hydroxylase-like FAD-dependent oxidoreductase